ncbi:MAG: phage tail tube protein [Actinoplanes sp.]
MSGRDGFGTQLKRATTITPGTTYEVIANVTSIGGPERTRETIDVTAHDSPGGWMEFIGGLKDGGEISCDINYDPAEATHDIDDDFDDSVPRNWQIVILPGDDDEHTWSFKAILTTLGDEFPYDDKMSRSLTLKVSGKPTLAQTGS